MTKRVFTYALLVAASLLCLGATALADTIRMKDGTVIRGQIIGFRDQQFTVLIGSRRSRMTIYIEDVDSIEFDAAAGATAAGDTGTNTANNNPPPRQQQPPPATANNNPPRNSPPDRGTPGTASPASSTSSFFPVNVRVRADNTSNGWTNTGLVVRRGQRLRIIASGRVSLGQGRFSTPTGIATLSDRNKLMPNEPTGALIAVIGDDNDDFILVGNRREVVAQRDGVLFLGVNEGDLNDNTGVYDVTIEAEAASRAAN